MPVATGAAAVKLFTVDRDGVDLILSFPHGSYARFVPCPAPAAGVYPTGVIYRYEGQWYRHHPAA